MSQVRVQIYDGWNYLGHATVDEEALKGTHAVVGSARIDWIDQYHVTRDGTVGSYKVGLTDDGDKLREIGVLSTDDEPKLSR